MKDPADFYSGLASLYHLVYEDWGKSVYRQALMLDTLVRENLGNQVESVLDVSCGIGTQTIGLSQLGYLLTASDISPDAVERAKAEARKLDLSVSFSVADMRSAYAHHARQFDVVISCDNSVPHLLTDADVLTAFQQLYQLGTVAIYILSAFPP